MLSLADSRETAQRRAQAITDAASAYCAAVSNSAPTYVIEAATSDKCGLEKSRGADFLNVILSRLRTNSGGADRKASTLVLARARRGRSDSQLGIRNYQVQLLISRYILEGSYKLANRP